MLREIYIDKYNKIVSGYKPEIFNSLRLLNTLPYTPSAERYTGIHQNMQSLTTTASPTLSTTPKNQSK
jgi:hypothetical protein